MERMDRRDEVMDELRHDLKELAPLIAAARGIVNHSPSQQIVVNAGGLAVWLAATCAALCFVMVVVLAMLYVDHSRKIDDLNHYLNAIYMQAPHLKPEDK